MQIEYVYPTPIGNGLFFYDPGKDMVYVSSAEIFNRICASPRNERIDQFTVIMHKCTGDDMSSNVLDRYIFDFERWIEKYYGDFDQVTVGYINVG